MPSSDMSTTGTSGNANQNRGRILIVVHSLARGGTERVATNLASSLLRLHYSVSICVLSNHRQAYDFEGAVFSPPPLPKNDIRKLIWLTRFLFRTVRKEAPDVVISLGWSANVFASIAGRIMKVPTIISERTDLRRYEIPWYWKLSMRLSYPSAGALVVLFPQFGDQVRHWNKRILVIPNFHTIDDISGLRDNSRRTQLVTIGRLVKEKRTERIIDAFCLAQRTHADLELVIVGDGPMYESLKTKIANDAIEGVRFVRDTDDPGRYLEKSSLFLFASEFEGFPNSVLEALAHGIPVIAFEDFSGTSALLRDCPAAYLIPQIRADLMAETIKTLVSDCERYSRLSTEAQFFASRYTSTEVVPQWVDLIEKLRHV